MLLLRAVLQLLRRLHREEESLDREDVCERATRGGGESCVCVCVANGNMASRARPSRNPLCLLSLYTRLLVDFVLIELSQDSHFSS